MKHMLDIFTYRKCNANGDVVVVVSFRIGVLQFGIELDRNARAAFVDSIFGDGSGISTPLTILPSVIVIPHQSSNGAVLIDETALEIRKE